MLKKFTKSVFIYGLAPSFGKFIGIFLIPIYTRVFSPEEYGVIDLFNVIVAFLVIFVNLEIQSAVGRYFYTTNDIKNRKILVSTALWNEIILSFIIVFLAILFSRDINLYLLQTLQYNNIFLIALLLVGISCIYTYLGIVMRYENKPWLFLTVNIIQIVVKVSISLVTILILRWGILGIFIGLIAGELVGSIILLINLRRYITFVYDINILKKLLMFSIPLTPGVIAYYFNQFFNRFVMLRYLSLADIGLYAIAFNIASVFALIRVAFKMAWEPFMYENLKENEHRQIYVRIYKFMILCLCISVILITLFSKELLMLLTTENYFSVYPLIGFLSIHIVITIFVHIVEIGPKITKKTFLNSLSSITGIFANLILMFILIPKFGFMGAGYSLCIGSLVTFVLSWYFTSRVYPIEFPKIYTIVFLFFTFFFAFLNVMLDINLMFKFLLLISIFLLLAYYLKDEIKKFGPELFHLMKLEHKVKIKNL